MVTLGNTAMYLKILVSIGLPQLSVFVICFGIVLLQYLQCSQQTFNYYTNSTEVLITLTPEVFYLYHTFSA